MKRLVIGDPHFNKGNEEETDLLESEVDRVIREENPDEIVLLGDVNDRYDLQSNCRAKQWISKLSSLVSTVLLVGNHERMDNTDYHSRIHHYIGMEKEGLRIVSEAVKINDVIYVPYVRPGMFQSSLTYAGGIKNVKWIFAHQSFVGCGEPNAVDKWDSNIRIISGHIHTRMSLNKNEKQNNILSNGWTVYYPGSSTCNTFLDTDTRYLAIVEDNIVREIPIQCFKRRIITFTPNFTDNDVDEVIKSDKYTRIILIGTYTECSEMRNSELIREAERKGAEIKSQSTEEGEVIQCTSYAVLLPFQEEIISKMKEKWSTEDLNYLLNIMSK